MFDGNILKRHRLSGLANGVLIGMGLTSMLAGQAYGIILIVVGSGIEIWQRSRIPKS